MEEHVILVLGAGWLGAGWLVAVIISVERAIVGNALITAFTILGMSSLVSIVRVRALGWLHLKGIFMLELLDLLPCSIWFVVDSSSTWKSTKEGSRYYHMVMHMRSSN